MKTRTFPFLNKILQCIQLMCHLQHPRGLERLFLPNRCSTICVLFFWSVWVLSCFYLRRHILQLEGKAVLCWGSAVLLLGVTGRSAGLCPSPFCRQGNGHAGTLELPNSQLRSEPQTGVSHTKSAVQALPNHPAELVPCVLLPRAHCKHTSYPCSWNTALLNHSEAPHGAEPLHPVWPLRSRLLFVAIIDPGDVKYG